MQYDGAGTLASSTTGQELWRVAMRRRKYSGEFHYEETFNVTHFLSMPLNRLTFGLLAALPAFVVASPWFLLSDVEPHYTRIISQIVALVFVMASFLFGLCASRRRQTSEAVRSRLFWSALAGLIVTVISLFALTQTSLCVGMDNGDGTNTCDDCVVVAAFGTWLFVCAGFPVLTFSSLIIAKIHSRLARSRDVPTV